MLLLLLNVIERRNYFI